VKGKGKAGRKNLAIPVEEASGSGQLGDSGSAISAAINGTAVATVTDSSYLSGISWAPERPGSITRHDLSGLGCRHPGARLQIRRPRGP